MNLKKKIIYSLLSISFFSCERHDKEDYLLPDKYIGKTLIIFNQEDGQEIEYNKSRRVYRLGESGIFSTQFDINPGGFLKGDRIFFYVDKNGNRLKEIKWITNFALFHRVYDPAKKKNTIKLNDVVAVSEGIIGTGAKYDSLLPKDFRGHISYLLVDTFKNLIKFQRPPDSIYYEQQNKFRNKEE